MKLALTIRPDEHGLPAFEILSSRMRMSRLMIKRIRLYGSLHVNGQPARMKDPLAQGDLLEAAYEESGEVPSRRDHTIPILFEDEWLIVCEKPAGLVTHPSWQHMDDSLIQRLSDQRLHPVMRLDRETSGLIVIAKNGFSHHVISQGPTRKEYLGILHGCPESAEGTIDAPIGRADDSIMIREVRDDGYPSVTHYKVIRYNEDKDISLVSFLLETGRCHQIRVHSRYIGHPIVGDGLYGPSSNDYPDPQMPSVSMDKRISRQALHASSLSFVHPISHETLSFTSDLPQDMRDLLKNDGD